MPICPNCGAHLKDDQMTCSCGATVENDLNKLLVEEAKKVEILQDYKEKCMASFENKEYDKAVEYADMIDSLGIGSDASVIFIRGKSLFYLEKFYDAVKCFDEYIKDYKNSFYRFADISGAYEWKAAALWQLGAGFQAIKNYYSAFDYIEHKPCSKEEKLEARTRINEAKQDVINSSKGMGVYNPRFGEVDVDFYDWIQNKENSLFIMQNLYDAINEVKTDTCKLKTLKIKDDLVCVEFEDGLEILEKYFDGTPSFID